MKNPNKKFYALCGFAILLGSLSFAQIHEAAQAENANAGQSVFAEIEKFTRKPIEKRSLEMIESGATIEELTLNEQILNAKLSDLESKSQMIQLVLGEKNTPLAIKREELYQKYNYVYYGCWIKRVWAQFAKGDNGSSPVKDLNEDELSKVPYSSAICGLADGMLPVVPLSVSRSLKANYPKQFKIQKPMWYGAIALSVIATIGQTYMSYMDSRLILYRSNLNKMTNDQIKEELKSLMTQTNDLAYEYAANKLALESLKKLPASR